VNYICEENIDAKNREEGTQKKMEIIDIRSAAFEGMEVIAEKMGLRN